MEEALQQGVKIESAVATPDFWARRSDLVHQFAASGIQTDVASLAQFNLIRVTEHSAGVVAIVSLPPWPAKSVWDRVREPQFLGVLTVGVQDPGNLGTILRTQVAAGGSAAWMGVGCAEVLSPKTLRSSAGTVFRLPLLEEVDPTQVLEQMHTQQVQSLAAMPQGGRPYTTVDLTLPTLLVLGGEGPGLDDTLVAQCSQAVHIPMPGGTESLNVASAAAVILFEAVRQRRLVQAVKRSGLRDPRT